MKSSVLFAGVASLAAVALSSVAPSSLAFAQPAPRAPLVAPAPRPLGALYHLDVSITGLDPDPAAPPATFGFVLPERERAKLSSEDNVPLDTASGAPRQSVGARLEMSFEQQGKLLLVNADIELSSADALTSNGRTIHRMSTHVVEPITPETPNTFATIYDTAGHRRYEITITAKKWQ